MAIYEYSCPECAEEFEVMRPVSQVHQPACCPKCGAPGRKLVSVFASKAEYSIKVPSKDAFRGTPGKAKRKRTTANKSTKKSS